MCACARKCMCVCRRYIKQSKKRRFELPFRIPFPICSRPHPESRRAALPLREDPTHPPPAGGALCARPLPPPSAHKNIPNLSTGYSSNPFLPLLFFTHLFLARIRNAAFLYNFSILPIYIGSLSLSSRRTNMG